jgi:guanine deaminase
VGGGRGAGAVWLHPRHGTVVEVALGNLKDAEDALAKAFTLATPADLGTCVDGARVGLPVAASR